MTIDISALMASIRAGEDTTLELKEVAFRGRRMQLGSDGTCPEARLAEAFASMANTEGGTVVLGVRDNGVPTGIEFDKRDLVEQLVINAATENCQPMIVPRLDWEFLHREDGGPRLCLIIGVPASAYEVHPSDAQYVDGGVQPARAAWGAPALAAPSEASWLIEQSPEIVVASVDAARHDVFPRLGLTDAALLDVVSVDAPLLTVDLDLYVAALASGDEAAINFNHWRDW